MKPRLLCCTLALLLAAPLRAAPPAPTPHPTMVLQVGHSGAISALAYSSDGRMLATGGDDGVRLWDTASGQVKASLPGVPVVILAFAPDGKTLATEGRDDNLDPVVLLWDVASGQLKASLEGQWFEVTTVAFSPDGKTLAAGGSDDNLDPIARLWDVASGRLKATLTLAGGDGGGWALALAFSPDGQTLATGSGGSPAVIAGGGGEAATVQLWDAASGQLKATLKPNLNRLDSLAFSADGQTLATGGRVGRGDPDTHYSPGPVQLWDVASGQLKVTLTDATTPLAFSPDGKTLATGGRDDNLDPVVLLWDVASGQPRATLKGAFDPFAFSPDSKTLATGDGGLWDVASGQLEGTLGGGDALAFSPDGQMLATGGSDGVQLWDVASRRLKAIVEERNDGETWSYPSPDGQTLAFRSLDPATNLPTLRLWEVASGQLKASLTGAYVPFFSPDSQTLATNGGDGVRLWDTATGQLKATLTGTGFPLAFSPGSKTLATASSYNGSTGLYDAVKLWDVPNGQLKATLPDECVPLFSSDGKTVAAASYSDTTRLWTVRLWDTASGQLKATLPNADSPVFSADSQTLATRDDSRHLHLWDVASVSPILITAQTSLAQFPAWLIHPFSWTVGEPEVSLLDPVDEHVLATLQALPDAPASLLAPPPDPAAPPTAGNWITTTPDGYFAGSPNVAEFIRWSVDGVLYPAAAYWDVYNRPDLVRQALKIPGG